MRGPKIRFEGLKSDDWDGSGRRFEPPGAIDPRGYAGRYGFFWKTPLVRDFRRFWSVMIFGATMRVVSRGFLLGLPIYFPPSNTHLHGWDCPLSLTLIGLGIGITRSYAALDTEIRAVIRTWPFLCG